MVHCGACGQPLVIRSADILEDKIVLRARCSGCQRVWLAEVPASAFYSPDERSGDDTSPPSRVPKPSGRGDGRGGDDRAVREAALELAKDIANRFDADGVIDRVGLGHMKKTKAPPANESEADREETVDRLSMEDY